jgi:hypothetical protein
MRHLLNHARDAGKHRKYEMANELALIKNETALTHLAAVAAQAQEMRLLKFSKGNWLIGDDELSADRLFIAHVHQLAHGWVKFIDGKVADQRVGIVANGFVVTDRSELGDTDRGQWEREPSGAPRDPWSKQYYLPLEDAPDRRRSRVARAAIPRSGS